MSWLIGTCLFSLSLLLLSIAGLLRLLPHFLRLVHIGLRGFLILSFRFYYLVLNRLAPGIYQRSGMNVLVGHGRVIGSVFLSLVLGVLFLLLVGWSVNGWSVGLCILHGLSVGLAWDEIERPGGLQMGVKIQ